MPDLQQAIELETVDTLKKRYVTYFGVKPKQTRKAFLVQALFEGLSDPSLLQSYLEKLTDLERAFVRESVHNYGGLVERGRFEARYGVFPEDKRKHGYFYYGTGLPELVEVLFYPAERYGDIKIPAQLMLTMKPLVEPPEQIRLITCALPEPLPHDAKCFDREHQVFGELHSLLILLQDKQLKVSDKTGVASAATLRKAASHIQEYYESCTCDRAKGMEFILSYGWLRLLGNSPFSRQVKGTLISGQSSSSKCAETLKTIWEHWVANRSVDEFQRIDAIKGQNGKGKRFFTDVVERRQEIIAYLKDCPVNSWIELETFSKFMYVAGSTLEVTTQPDFLYRYDPGWGEFCNASWDQLEARYLRCFLAEYTATLGLVDVVMSPPDFDGAYYDDFGDSECLSRYDGLQYFRLTPLGAFVLGVSDDYKSETASEGETQLCIHRQGRIVFNQNPTPWEQRFLSLYADQNKETDWKLSRKKIMEAIQVGSSIDDLKAFLLTRDEQPFFPEDCESLLKQAELNRDAVTFQAEMLMVKCKSADIAELVVNDKVLSKYCQRVGKSQIVIPKNKEKKFRDSLMSMGIGFA